MSAISSERLPTVQEICGDPTQFFWRCKTMTVKRTIFAKNVSYFCKDYPSEMDICEVLKLPRLL